jgi:phosphatidate cytidylyltransferase
MSEHLKQRLLISSIATFLLFLIVYFSHIPYFQPIFLCVNVLIVSLALLEYYHLVKHKGFQPLMITGIFCSIIYVISVYFTLWIPHWEVLPNLILLVSFALFFLNFFQQQTQPIVNLALTSFGIIYLTIPLTYALKINYFPLSEKMQDGRLWLAYVFAVTKMTDIGAYFCGKLWGRHPLAPTISPKKTIEGAIGGLLISILTSLLFNGFFGLIQPFLTLNLFQSIWLGILMSFVAQFGDLSESILKRDAGVKDSSRLPGLGGILDIVDSLLFALPLMYFLLQIKAFNE